MILNISLPGKAAKAEFAYTGAYTQKQITSGGVTYDLYTLTGSGTLTVTGTAKNAAIWGCGGGAGGGSGYGSATSASGGSGGGGGYAADYLGDIADGAYVVTIAAAGVQPLLVPCSPQMARLAETVVLAAVAQEREMENLNIHLMIP